MGLGFNGGEMLALAIGGCFCNDLRYVADALGVGIDAIAIDVTLQLDGSPALVTDAVLDVAVAAAPGVDVAALIARARAESTIGNSVARGIAVTVRATSL
jgi:organic hydroperoxide reductase OsmC/OhrA